MKIKRLTVENIKRISAVEITPTGDLVILTGKNSQGKSSILDSICFALGGKDAMKKTPKPLRDGAETGRIIIDLEDFLVTRWWTNPTTSYLKVTTPDNAVYPSPQALLEKWIGRLTFDPLEFLEMKPTEQVDWLMDFIGKKEELIKLNLSYSSKYEERSFVNKEHRKMKVYYDELPEPQVDLPDAITDMETFNERDRAAMNLNNQKVVLRNTYKVKKEQIKSLEDDVVTLQTQINTKIETANNITKELEEITKQGEALGVPESLELIKEEKEETEAMNTKIQERDLKYKTDNAMGDKKVEADTITLVLEDIQKKKRALIEKAEFPIKGLSFDENGVLYNNIPFIQCSQSDQLKISFSIGMKMNPDLRVIMTKDANALDEDNLKLLTELSETNNYQLWLEKIDENKLPAIIIEDGHIKGVPLLSDETKQEREE